MRGRIFGATSNGDGGLRDTDTRLAGMHLLRKNRKIHRATAVRYRIGQPECEHPEDTHTEEPRKNGTFQTHRIGLESRDTGDRLTGSNIRDILGGEGPACCRRPDRDAALPRARHMFPEASSSRDRRQRDVWWRGATIFGRR